MSLGAINQSITHTQTNALTTQQTTCVPCTFSVLDVSPSTTQHPMRSTLVHQQSLIGIVILFCFFIFAFVCCFGLFCFAFLGCGGGLLLYTPNVFCFCFFASFFGCCGGLLYTYCQ